MSGEGDALTPLQERLLAEIAVRPPGTEFNLVDSEVREAIYDLADRGLVDKQFNGHDPNSIRLWGKRKALMDADELPLSDLERRVLGDIRGLPHVRFSVLDYEVSQALQKLIWRGLIHVSAVEDEPDLVEAWPVKGKERDMLVEGAKNDRGKIRMELLPVQPAIETAAVLTIGADKYEAYNWAKGIHFSRLYGAMRRHMETWWAGKDDDDETSITHLAHAMCCLQFIMDLRHTRPEFDDRPIGKIALAEFEHLESLLDIFRAEKAAAQASGEERLTSSS